MPTEFIKKFTRQLLQFTGIVLYHCGLAKWVIAKSSRTRVVLYHAVENIRSSYTRGLGVTVDIDTFELHLRYFERYYQVLGMNHYLNIQASGKQDTLNTGQLLITFDDGYASVLDHALPLLEKKGMPATTYLIGNAVRGRMVWVNRLNQALNDFPAEAREVLASYPGLTDLSRRGIIHRIQTTFDPRQIDALIAQFESTIPNLTLDEEKLFCTPDDIKHMQTRGMEFGFHSNDHWNLGRCKDSELDATLTINGLEQLLNCNTFAYPFGYFVPAAIGRLTRQGYDGLMTVGTNNDRFSGLHLDRVELFDASHARLFAKMEIEEPVLSAARQWWYKRKTQTSTVLRRTQKPTV